MAKSANLNIPDKVKIIDLAKQYKILEGEIDSAIKEVLASGNFVLGTNVKAFEQELADYLECKHVISCANGTDALYLSLRALGIGQGDEVITVSFSFFATASTVVLVGATPVFVDIRGSDFNIDPSKIEEHITSKTKAIIPVHLYGNPCAITEVMKIAKKHNLAVIEDAAQAIGAHSQGKKVGTFGDIGTFSLFPTKNLGAFGDGGAICTNDEKLAKTLMKLRVHGSSVRYVHDVCGLNSRLDELQAAILRVKLRHLDKWNDKRRQAARFYTSKLKDLQGLVLPEIQDGHVFHQYTVRHSKRDVIAEKLKESNIESIIYYPIPIHEQEALKKISYKKGALPVTDKMCHEVLSLPMHPMLAEDTQSYIIDSIKKALN